MPHTLVPLGSLKGENKELPNTLVHVDAASWSKLAATAQEDPNGPKRGNAFLAHKLPGGDVFLEPVWFENGSPSAGVFVVEQMSAPTGMAFFRLCVRGIYVDPRLDDPGCRICLHGDQPPLRCMRDPAKCTTDCRVVWKTIRTWGTFYYCICLPAP